MNMEHYFEITAPSGRPFVILQLTDMQVIDASQCRTPNRLRADELEAWETARVSACCYTPISAVIEKTRPDLIIITGDIVYGEFDDSGRAMEAFIAFMESFEIPWAPVFGNHDNETRRGIAWQCHQFSDAPHCLFSRGDVTGNCNYTIGIRDGDRLARVLYMMDSNACGGAEDPAAARRYGMADDQIEQMVSRAAAFCAETGAPVPGFACFHIPVEDYITAMIDAGYQTADDGGAAGDYILAGTAPAGIIDRDVLSPNTHENGDPETVLTPAHPGDSGYKNERMPRGHFQTARSEQFRAAHVDGVFMGHCHKCQLSVMGKDGIRYTHGVKSGTYDYHTRGRIGGTKITLGEGLAAFDVEQIYI